MRKNIKDVIDSGIFIPVFCQPWYLDAMCGENNWDYSIYSKNDEILGFMPYFLKKKLGISYITMPEVTLFMGPILKHKEFSTYYKKLSFEKEVISEILQKLPKSFKTEYSLHHEIDNFLPFHWQGYQINPRVTYHLKLNTSIEETFQSFNSSVKRQINKASKSLSVVRNDDINTFIEINKLSYVRQNVSLPYTVQNIEEMYNSAKHDNGRIQFATDKDGNTHAANLLLWDDRYMYYYLSGMNPEFKDSGAQSLLIYEAIKLAKEKGLEFNFFGSRQEGIERFIRAFGSKQLISYIISKR